GNNRQQQGGNDDPCSHVSSSHYIGCWRGQQANCCYNRVEVRAIGTPAEVSMDPVDAAGFALLQIRDGRLVTTLLRSISERAAADDPDPLPPRERDEPLLAWACRCR